MMQYLDKNGTRIQPGDTIRHNNGDTELVCELDHGDLGVDATNHNNPDAPISYYPLSNFDMSEWEIVKEV